MEEFWDNKKILNLWKLWNSLSFTKLVLINQMIENNIIIEFAVNVNFNNYKNFFDKLSEIVIKKNPSGSISFINYLSQNIEYYRNENFINTQFKKYRIEFVDSFIKYKEKDLKEKSEIFYNNIIKLLKEY